MPKPSSWRVIVGDCRDVLATLDEGSVQTCVTSPPYFGLRDYGHNGQIGLEPTPDEFVAALVEVFRDVRRVLRDDGTVWLNLGDSYSGSANSGGIGADPNRGAAPGHKPGVPVRLAGLPLKRGAGIKPKDLIGVPWMVAFALRADGWFLRSDIIWHKPNPMPESVTDRPTKAHEYLFLLSKSARYFYDADAIREDAQPESATRYAAGYKQFGTGQFNGSPTDNREPKEISPEELAHLTGRNKRSVWTVTTQPYAGAHFATFPPKLIEPCILAGCPEGGTVLDPFNGAGTTGMVALRHNRSYVGIELNPEYAELARRRIVDDAPLLNQMAEAA